MSKSPDAFRTISEVAEWLATPAHVLRFWESRFSQVKPVKRAGGRRYYRPADMLLLGGIKKLLHEDGLTIKGVQKILREEGIKHVASFSQPLDMASDAKEIVDADVSPTAPMPEPQAGPEPVSQAITEPEAEDRPEPAPEPEFEASDAPQTDPEPEPEIEDAQIIELIPAAEPEPEPEPEPAAAPTPEPAPPAPAARNIETPPDPDDDADLTGDGATTRLLRGVDPDALTGEHEKLAAIYARLAALRDRMAGEGGRPRP